MSKCGHVSVARQRRSSAHLRPREPQPWLILLYESPDDDARGWCCPIAVVDQLQSWRTPPPHAPANRPRVLNRGASSLAPDSQVQVDNVVGLPPIMLLYPNSESESLVQRPASLESLHQSFSS